MTARLAIIDDISSGVIVRDIEGNISLWNRGAERVYGWSPREAVGNVSHDLLETVFPSPLEDINSQLLSKKYWEGELIHTLSNGVRVKVCSRWELEKDNDGQLRVIEINRAVSRLLPENAHFQKFYSSSFFSKLSSPWFLLPCFVLLVLFSFFIFFTEMHPAPLLEQM
jgi:PAS domain S-box-containing protein